MYFFSSIFSYPAVLILLAGLTFGSCGSSSGSSEGRSIDSTDVVLEDLDRYTDDTINRLFKLAELDLDIGRELGSDADYLELKLNLIGEEVSFPSLMNMTDRSDADLGSGHYDLSITKRESTNERVALMGVLVQELKSERMLMNEVTIKSGMLRTEFDTEWLPIKQGQEEWTQFGEQKYDYQIQLTSGEKVNFKGTWSVNRQEFLSISTDDRKTAAERLNAKRRALIQRVEKEGLSKDHAKRALLEILKDPDFKKCITGISASGRLEYKGKAYDFGKYLIVHFLRHF